MNTASELVENRVNRIISLIREIGNINICLTKNDTLKIQQAVHRELTVALARLEKNSAEVFTLKGEKND